MLNTFARGVTIIVSGELGLGASTLLEMSGIRMIRVDPGVKVFKAVEKALLEIKNVN
jgi:predicted Fe-Mo cluster-binding NifX family protein